MKNVNGYLKLFSIMFVCLSVQLSAQWSTNPAVNNAICTATDNQHTLSIVSDGAGGAIIAWNDQKNGYVNFDIYAQHINASGAVQWDANGVAICTATRDQTIPTIVSDGSGGAIIMWQDLRNGVESDIYAQHINAVGAIQWSANGVAICTETGDQFGSMIVSDGAGGAIIAWQDFRTGTNYDIYAQRINPSGSIQWSANGVAISTATGTQNPTIVSDESGGAIITWEDVRGGTNYDIYAQRINASGSVQWSANGVAICTATNEQQYPSIVGDVSGGAVIVWQDLRSGGRDIYAQRINASGAVQWSADGVAICTATGDQYSYPFISDDSGGAIILWQDYRSGGLDIYAQRINASGAVQWTGDGVAICTDISGQNNPKIVSDNSGGAIITWYDGRNGYTDIFAQRINTFGAVQWSANGIAICTAVGNQFDPVIVSDGTGGTIIMWVDDRNGVDSDIYASHIEGLPRYPVLLIPGIAATYPANTNDIGPWMFERGIHPSALQIDPLAHAYDDIIKTLKNVGYVEGKDLFVVNYDWRVPPAPSDVVFDGFVSGITAASITDLTFEYSIDYLGYYLKQAVNAWENNHPGTPLDSVNIISHSTGGLVARTYIQSAAYRGTFDGTKKLPAVKNLIMIGVPNRGASKPWNTLHDNWGVDVAFQLVLSKILNMAYQKVLAGAIISGPDYNITLASLTDGSSPDPQKIRFIKKFNPLARSLLATYNFIDTGNGFTTINGNQLLRNNVVLDLNAGLDLVLNGDPNSFADSAKVTAMFGTNMETPTSVVKKIGTSGGENAIVQFTDYALRDALPGEVWYKDNIIVASGDGTVPLESSRNQFVGDSRVTLKPYTRGINTLDSVTHLGLMYNSDVQKAVLGILGQPYTNSNISTGLHESFASLMSSGVNIAANIIGGNILGAILDPIDGFIIDGQGRRLGYSAATGPLTEIPGSVWLGNADGLGWVMEPLVGPLSLKLSGLGGNYYSMVSVLSESKDSGLTVAGVLAAGDSVVLSVAFIDGIVLPVELVSFTASVQKNTIELQWKTATETNNYGFEIEKSRIQNSEDRSQNSATAWVNIGFVEGHGTTNAPKEYSFSDKNLSTGKYSYRLKQIDRDGKFAYSQTVELEIGSLPKEFALMQNYPNPFNPSTEISYQIPVNSPVTLKVYDAIGREVATLVDEMKEAGYYSTTFDASKLSSGIYFVRLSSERRSQIQKMMVLK